MEPPERATELPVDLSQSLEGSTHQLGSHSESRSSSQEQLGAFNGGLQRLAFQDSNLSPALSLLPVNTRPENNLTEYSLLQESDTEFAPLRPYPDVSMASVRFHTTQGSELEPLSQHPLTQTTTLSEEGASSSGSLSQHSLSPGVPGRREVTPAISSKGHTGTKKRKPEMFQDMASEVAKDETFFLRKDVSAQHLLDLLQKDVGLQSSTSSAVSSASETSVKSTASFTKCGKSIGERQGPSGEASLPQQPAQQPDRVLNPGQSQARLSEVGNITMGPRSPRPDDSSEALRRELLSEVERRSSCEDGSEKNQQETPTSSLRSTTPKLKDTAESKTRGMRTNVGGVPYTGPFSAAVERIQRETDLWSSGNQTGIDGSYLSFLPQSQSTPGVFKVPTRSGVKPKLSAIESSKDNSHETSSGVSQQPAVPVTESDPSDTASQHPKDATEVQSLPSLTYMQKVDAWRANQSSGKTSLFDSLALQGFSGVSPKKKAYDAVSDSLSRILSQQARSLQQPLLSSATNQRVPQSVSAAPSGSSSPRRGEAVGSAPSEKDNTGSAAPPSISPFGRSQSHSSLNTVVMSVNKEQQTDGPPEQQEREDDSPPLPPPPLPPPPLLSSTVQPPMSLGHFSDVSLDQDLTMSSSQESYSDVKKQASIGASSVVSLEIDNYAPYWTSKLSTPPPLPRPRELNIDERIPLYLHNLGIDQSPSAILTPFAPRGPIREPEFSPTDLYTLKGSTGTPARSTQPSEGGSPHKGEFSRSSILSVDSSASMTFSLDSLGAAASVPEQQSSRLTSNQTTKQPADELTREEANLKSLLRTSVIVDEATEDSFVSSKALVEIQELLSHAENVMLTSSSASSSAPPTARQLLPDEDSSTSLNKRSLRLQDSSFSSSFTSGDPRTPTSLLWTRSSSDSMLMSDKQRQRSVGQENTSSSRQLDYPLTQAPNAAPAVAPHQSSQDNDGAATSLILSKSVRRTEPEGCSAAPPASAPNPPVATSPPPAASAHQLPSSPEDTEEVTEEEKRTAGGPTQSSSSSSSSSSSPAIKDADQEDLSDASSQSSLAVRVAKLLQSESPATMVSSTPSTTDQEDGKDWIKVKTSGQQTETQKLNREDRKRIEEIKRELLLKNPFKSQSSTDTESSSAFSFKVPKVHDVLQPAAPSDANDQPAPSLHSSNPADSVAASTNFIPPDLEAQVCEIAAREGVILPPKKPRALTSITIATCRRSTSPSPSTSPAPPHSPSPEPLLLTELSSSQPPSHSEDEDTIPSSVHEPNRSLIAISQPAPGNQRRQDTLGGQHEDPPPRPSEDMSIQEDKAQAFEQPQGESQAAESSTRTGHISRVHLILSPKSPSHSPTPADPPSHPNAASGPPRKDFVPLRQSSPAASSPDEGVGLTSPPEWLEARELTSRRAAERSDASTLYKPAVPQRKMADTPAQFVTAARHRVERPVNTEVPALLPYKPHGSEEFFYVPQTEADVSSAETTMESSHTGSDDAVPPRFSSEVLGQQDPGLDRGVTIRHTEGIYSKRLKTATFKMQEAKLGDATDASERSSPTSVSRAPKPSTQVSVAFTRVPSPGSREVRRRDRGTSPIQFLSDDPPELLRDRFHAVPVVQTSRGRQLPAGDPDLRRAASQQSSLDQLWRRFCLQWAAEESHAASDREASLLERLERLSRLIHSKRSITMPGTQEEEVEEGGYHPGTKLGRRRQEQRSKETKGDVREVRRSSEFREQERKAERGRREEEETSQPAADDSRTSSFSSSGFSHNSSHSQLLSTADRNESDDLSFTSASLSTVDTARLIRVFGVHKVQQLKSNSSLSKLYGAIDKQKEQRGQRKDKLRDPPPVITPSDQSLVADSSSSASTYTVPSRRGPSRTLVAKRTVKLVNKGVQAGDLEIVHNGTRRHTRDVGTTFPSPRVSGLTASRPLGAERERGAQRRSSSKGHSVQKQKKNKRSPSKPFPAGVSWFISADNLSSAARKENQPEERLSAAWFEPYSRERPWRQPLRQRHVQEDGDTEPSFTRHAEVDPDPRSKTLSDVLTRVSLQEALEVCRPGFISRSRQRVERLALQVEERKLQAAFSRERDELFDPPGGRERLHRPAGTAQLRRAVPRKEMIQRSKQIYNKLPEVQRRREEERRRAEYSSYRLNAQLYNKRITNHVLGRRSAWQ